MLVRTSPQPRRFGPIRSHRLGALALAVSLAACCDGTVRGQDAKPKEPKLIHSVTVAYPLRLAISPDGSAVAYISQTTFGNPPTATYSIGRWQFGPEGTKPEVGGGPSLSFEAFPHLTALAFKPDGKVLALGTSRGSMKDNEHAGLTLWDTESGKRKAKLISYPPFGPPPAPPIALDWHVSAIAWLGDGKTLATTGIGSPQLGSTVFDSVSILDATKGTVKATLSTTIGRMGPLAATRDGTLLAGCEGSGVERNCFLWDLAKSKTRWQFKPDKGADWYGLDFSHDGKLLAVGHTRQKEACVELLDVANGKSVRKLRVQAVGITGQMEEDRPRCFAAFPDRPWLVVGYGSGVIRVWDLEKSEVLFVLKLQNEAKPEDSALALSVARNGRRFASSHASKICVWEFGSMQP